MAAAQDNIPVLDIPVLSDQVEDRKSNLLTTDDLEKSAIEVGATSFNTCTRSGDDRRILAKRRKQERPESKERRCGRDRRMFSYF